METEKFWDLIAKIDWNLTDPLSNLIADLSKEEESEIESFYEILCEKLHTLDSQKYAESLGEYSYGNDYFSEDLFLYFRCYVIAKGKDYYNKVLKEIIPMKEQSFEKILDVVPKSYLLKTGKKWKLQKLPRYSKETFSNRSGWKNNESSIQDVILGKV